MKKIKIALVATIVASVSLLGSVSAAAAPTKSQSAAVSLIEKAPVRLIVKQTAKLKDGRQVTVFYQKDGSYVEVFSPSDLKGYTIDDLLNLETTTVSLATSVSGTSLYRCPVSKACSLLKQMVNMYL